VTIIENKYQEDNFLSLIEFGFTLGSFQDELLFTPNLQEINKEEKNRNLSLY